MNNAQNEKCKKNPYTRVCDTFKRVSVKQN